MTKPAGGTESTENVCRQPTLSSGGCDLWLSRGCPPKPGAEIQR